MIVGKSLIGPEELSRIFPTYHPVLVADVKCEESFQRLKSWIHVPVVIGQTRVKAEQFREIEGAKGILLLHASGIELANARHPSFILPPIRPGNSFLLPHSRLLLPCSRS